MKRHIFSYTEPTPASGYPAFIAIDRELGLHTIVVRSRDRGGEHFASISIPLEQVVELQRALWDYVREGP